MVLSHLNKLGVSYTIGNVWKSSFHLNWNHIKIRSMSLVMTKRVTKGQTVRIWSSSPNPCVMVLVPPISPSWTWIKLIKAWSLLLQILLKSTLAHVSWRNPLKASLNFLALSLVTGSTGTSNGSFDGWIASSPLSSKEFDLKSSPTSNKER